MDPREELEALRRLAELESRAAAQPNPDAALGGTVPFFGMDTGIPFPKSLEAAAVAAGKTTTRIGQGMQQGMDWLRGKDNPALAAKIADENARVAPLESQYPIATALGSALPAMAVPVGMAGGTAAALMKAAAAGAVPGALEYGSLEERGKRAGMGAAGGALGGLAGIGLGRALNPVRGLGPDAIESITSAAKKFDIPLTAGQATGSRPLQFVESALSQLPGAAGRMANVNRAQTTAINRATAKTMGATADQVTPEVVRGALKSAGSDIGDATSRFAVKLDMPLIDDLAAVEAQYMKRLPSQQRPVVQRYIDEILAHDGAIPGDVYQGIRADLGADAAGATKGSFKNALSGLQKSLDKAFSRSADEGTNAALATSRQQYTNAKTLKRAATATGDVSAARIAQAGRESSGDLGELASLLGKLKPLPDSGTAQRSFWMNAFTKNPFELFAPANLLGATGLPYTAATAVTRAPTKQYLTKGLVTVDPELEKFLIRYGGLLGLGTSGALQR